MARRRRRRRRRGVAIGDLTFFSFQDIITCITGILLLLTLMMATSISQSAPSFAKARSIHPDAALQLVAAADAESATKVRQLDEENGRLHSENDRLQQGLELLNVLASALSRPNGASIDQLIQQLPALAAQNAPSTSAAQAKIDELIHEIAELNDALAKLNEAITAAAAEKAKAAGQVSFLPGNQNSNPILVELDRDETRVGELSADGIPHLIAKNANWSDAVNAVVDRQAASDVSIVIFTHPQGVDRVSEIAKALRDRGYSVGWDVAPEKSIFKSPADEGGANGATP